MMSAPTAAERLGITYRQLDWWYRRGYVGTTTNSNLGSGYARQITRDEFRRLQRLAALVHAGIPVDIAVGYLEHAETTDTGLRITVDGVLTIELLEEQTQEHRDFTGPSGLAETG